MKPTLAFRRQSSLQSRIHVRARMMDMRHRWPGKYSPSHCHAAVTAIVLLRHFCLVRLSVGLQFHLWLRLWCSLDDWFYLFERARTRCEEVGIDIVVLWMARLVIFAESHLAVVTGVAWWTICTHSGTIPAWYGRRSAAMPYCSLGHYLC
jgi:hypothetical protein